jgi:glycine oxidase
VHSTYDVVIVGGGLMGSACAWELAREGARVLVLEKSIPGAEASSAAAGILGARAEAHGPGPMAELLRRSLALYPAWDEALREATGIDIELRQSGLLKVARTPAELARLAREAAWMRSEKGACARLTRRAVARLEPSLAPAAGGLRFAGDARVDPRRLFRAVHLSALRAGARFESGSAVRRVLVESGRAAGVVTDGNVVHRAHRVVIAAGSWSTLVPGVPLTEGSVVPARGQVVELETAAPPLRHVVWGPDAYLVPRDDGRVLVGATVEFVGYRHGVTARGVRDLLARAIALVPSLADATLRGAWSSFRPYTRDELPLLGHTEVEGLLLATGHYRNGILLAPITAAIVRALATGKKPPVDVTPFGALRLAP